MRKTATLGLVLFTITAMGGCPGLEGDIFPVWPANYFDEPPTDQGPFSVREYEVAVADGADGEPQTITVFAPENATAPLPAFFWIVGSNVQPYYHQSLHETLASWGYAVIVPEARRLTFTDFQYHRRNVDLAKQAIQLAVDGELGVDVNADQLAAGGYSIGATMALFTAAEEQRLKGVVLWAPTGSPFWTGVNPDVLLPQVTQSVFFLLAELDHVEPPSGFPAELKSELTQATISEYIIPQGLHLYFQQPTGADNITDPESTLTRFEQQGIAIERTQAFLDALFGITRE